VTQEIPFEDSCTGVKANYAKGKQFGKVHVNTSNNSQGGDKRRSWCFARHLQVRK